MSIATSCGCCNLFRVEQRPQRAHQSFFSRAGADAAYRPGDLSDVDGVLTRSYEKSEGSSNESAIAMGMS